MKDKTKKTILNLIGFLFLTLGIAAIINTVSNTKLGLAPILWMSYISLILLGIGILRKDSYLIASQIIILGIPYIFWNIDFYYYLINGKALFNIVNYFFVPGSLIGKIISSQHLFTIPLSLYALYLIKLKRKDAWKISFFQVAIVFLVTRIVTTPEKNVNCVFKSCTNFNFGLPHVLEWFLFYFMMILLTNWIITKFKCFMKN